MKKYIKKITAVSTKIIKKEQIVELLLEDSSIAEIPFSVICRLFPSINVRIVEALTGMFFCEFIVDEKKPNDYSKKGKWRIEHDDQILFDNYLFGNLKLFRDFQKINKTKILPSTDKHKASIQLFGEKEISFIPVFLFPSISGLLPDECHLLEGSFITTETWNAGEYIYNDGLPTMYVRKSGMILKNPVVRTESDFLTTYNKYKSSIPKSKAEHIEYPPHIRHDNFDREQFRKFKNATDGYGGYLSDDFINDGLGGEPDAIWNII